MWALAEVASKTMSISSNPSRAMSPSTPSSTAANAEAAGAGQAVGGGVDPDHGGDLEGLREPHDLEHQVGADVARADDRDLGPGPAVAGSGVDEVVLIGCSLAGWSWWGEAGGDAAEPGDVGAELVAGCDGHHRAEGAGEDRPGRRAVVRRGGTAVAASQARAAAGCPGSPRRGRWRPARVGRRPVAAGHGHGQLGEPGVEVGSELLRVDAGVAEDVEPGRGVVGDGVAEGDVPAGDAGVDDLQGGHHRPDRAADGRRGRTSRPRPGVSRSWPARTRPRPRSWAGAAACVSMPPPAASRGDVHVGVEDPEVGLVDPELGLHRGRGQPDLAAGDAPARRQSALVQHGSAPRRQRRRRRGR